MKIKSYFTVKTLQTRYSKILNPPTRFLDLLKTAKQNQRSHSNLLKKTTKLLCALGLLFTLSCQSGSDSENEGEGINTPPGQPSSPVLSVNPDNSVEISWTTISKADHYKLYRKSEDEEAYNLIYNGDALVSQDHNTKSGWLYYYILEACGDYGCSSESEPRQITTIPSPSEKPVRTLDNDQYISSSCEISISWSDVKGAAYYEVYRSSNNSLYDKIGTAVSTWPPYSDSYLSPAATYYYQIASCNKQNLCSAKSEALETETRPPHSSEAHCELSASGVDDNSVKVTFTQIDGVANESMSYKIYRSELPSEGYVNVYTYENADRTGENKDISWIDQNLDSNSQYYYRMKICLSPCDCTNMSEFVSASTVASQPELYFENSHLDAAPDVSEDLSQSWDNDNNRVLSFGGTGDSSVFDISFYQPSDIINSHESRIYIAACQNNNMLLIQYDYNGHSNPELKWLKETTSSSFLCGYATAADENAVYVGGQYCGNFDERPARGECDAVIMKYKYTDSEHYKQWTKFLVGDKNDKIEDIFSDQQGNIYITGYTGGGLLNDAGEIETPIKTNRDIDMFLAKYNANGQQLWARQSGAPGDDTGVAMTMDKKGNIYVAGQAIGNMVEGEPSGEKNVFLAKYNSAGDQLWTRMTRDQHDNKAIDLIIGAGDKIYIVIYDKYARFLDSSPETTFVITYNSKGERL